MLEVQRWDYLQNCTANSIQNTEHNPPEVAAADGVQLVQRQLSRSAAQDCFRIVDHDQKPGIAAGPGDANKFPPAPNRETVAITTAEQPGSALN